MIVSDLAEILYPLPDSRRTPLTLLRWWESRRLFYNKVVGATGLFTLTGVFLLAPDRADLVAPQAALVVLVYGVTANFCYSLGWVVEMLARWLWGREAPVMGPLMFRQGLIFSVGLTLFPLGIAILFNVLRVLFALVS
jgi:hypothetical protein